jgi:hypothetical protein
MKLTKAKLKEMIRAELSKSMMGEGGPGSGRPTKPGSKRHMEKGMDKAVSDANAKLDAAEKAAKKKKRKKPKGGDVGGPAHPNVNERVKEDVPIPPNVKRFMNKFIGQVKNANLNRQKQLSILSQVIKSLKVDPGRLMMYVRKIKKDL